MLSQEIVSPNMYFGGGGGQGIELCCTCCVVLHCAVPCCAVLCCAVLCCAGQLTVCHNLSSRPRLSCLYQCLLPASPAFFLCVSDVEADPEFAHCKTLGSKQHSTVRRQ